MNLSIELRNVSFSYDPKLPLFNGLDLELPADKTILLTGENGTGKTTLASLTAALLRPLSGRVLFSNAGEKLMHKHNPYRHLAYLRQRTEDNILCATPFEDLKLWLSTHSDNGFEAGKVITRVLEEWNLTSQSHTPVWEMSAGELKCLALAGISLHKDRYWIMDEPLASLDIVHTELLLETLAAKQEIRRGMLIISHRIDVFAPLVDEILTLGSQGRVVRA